MVDVRVNPLEWSTGWGVDKAETPIGHYFMEARRDGAFDVRLENVWNTWASTSDAAKAAAQADYERRIRSTVSDAVQSEAEREAEPVAFPECVLGLTNEKITLEFENSEDARVAFDIIEHTITSPPTSELEALRKRVAELEKAVDGLLAPFEHDECRKDHHGYCQAHFLEEECCVATARRVREGGKVE